MSVNQVLANFPPNSNFVIPTSNQGPITMTVGGPPGGGGPPFTTTQALWVAPWGSDTTGDGSEDNPFLTIAHAQSVVTDASPTKFYNIMLYPGTFTENVAFKAFVNIVGFNPSTTSNGFYPSDVVGNFSLGPSFGGVDVGQFCLVSNVDVDGVLTLDFVAATSPSGFVSFSNCQTEDAIAITGGLNNSVEFHDVVMLGDYTQTNAQVEFFNTNGGLGGFQTLNFSATGADGGNLRAFGGSWGGDVHVTYAADEGAQCVLSSEGFSMSRGSIFKTAGVNGEPHILANMGDLPENVQLVTGENPLSSLDPQMRISHPFTGITGAVAGTAVTTFTFVVPPALIGLTSIEDLQCSCSPVGSTWGTIIGPHAAIYAFRYVESGGSGTVLLDILNTGAGFNISDSIAFNFYGYLPSVLA